MDAAAGRARRPRPTGTPHTACLLLTAALTGMRESELMELRRGCRSISRHSDGMIRYRIKSKLVKGQPLGGTSEEWVVIETVYHAVGMAEQLSRSSASPETWYSAGSTSSTRYPWFRNWANGPAGQRLGLAPIPGGAVNLRMLRRTLARELAYRPGGLLAAKFALKHVSVATTEGYAARPGGAQGKLLAEIAEDGPTATSRSCSPSSAATRTASCPPDRGPRTHRVLRQHRQGPGRPGHGRPPRRRQRPARPEPAQQACPGAAPRRGELLLVHRPVPRPLPEDGRNPRRRQAAGRNVRLGPLPAGHPPPLPPARLGDAVASTTAFIGSLGRTRTAERARLQAELDRAKRVLDSIDAAAAARESR